MNKDKAEWHTTNKDNQQWLTQTTCMSNIGTLMQICLWIRPIILRMWVMCQYGAGRFVSFCGVYFNKTESLF
jgi:hypothetical protein